MDLKTFQELSKRTMPFGGVVSNQVEFENMLGNYAMGLLGEVVELFEAKNNNSQKIISEIGDVSHYAVGIAILADCKMDFEPIVLNAPIKSIFNCLLYLCKDISEAVKKHIYHRHPLLISSRDIIDIFNCLYSLGEYYGKDNYGNVLKMNIDKLKKRYQDGFNTADSIARIDVVEGE